MFENKMFKFLGIAVIVSIITGHLSSIISETNPLFGLLMILVSAIALGASLYSMLHIICVAKK